MLLELLIVVIVLAIVFYLIERYVATLLPQPWRVIVLVILALIAVIYLLNRFLGIG